MSGTVAAAAKARLVGVDNILTGLPGLAGVIVAYGMPRDVGRELIYGGKVSGPVELAAMRGSNGRIRREEDLAFHLFIRVYEKGQQTAETAEARVTALSEVVEDWIAANPNLAGLPNLILAKVQNVELDSWLEDDGATAEMTLIIGFMSFLT